MIYEIPLDPTKQKHSIPNKQYKKIAENQSKAVLK